MAEYDPNLWSVMNGSQMDPKTHRIKKRKHDIIPNKNFKQDKKTQNNISRENELNNMQNEKSKMFFGQKLSLRTKAIRNDIEKKQQLRKDSPDSKNSNTNQLHKDLTKKDGNIFNLSGDKFGGTDGEKLGLSIGPDVESVMEAKRRHKERELSGKYSKKAHSVARCNFPGWCGVLLVVSILVMAAVVMLVIFMLHQEDNASTHTKVSRCSDTFVMFPDQYHQPSELNEDPSNLEQCMTSCLKQSRANCAGINYNKEGEEGNRCYMLKYTALSSNYGTYRGVNEYQRRQCDSIKEQTTGPNISGRETTSAGKPKAPPTSTPSIWDSVCPATYTKKPNKFGVGGIFLSSAGTAEECLRVCSLDPACPAIEYDVIGMTCYVHREPFDGQLYEADRLNHYDKNPCMFPTTRPTSRTSKSFMTPIRTTGLNVKKTTYQMKKTTRPDIIQVVTTMYKPFKTTPFRRTTAESTTVKTTSTPTTSTHISSASTMASKSTTVESTSSTQSTTLSSTTLDTTTQSSTAETTWAPPIKTDKCTPLDVTLIVDTSGRLDGPASKNFVHVLNLMKNIINNLKVGPSNTRVSAIIFSTLALSAFHLEDYGNKPDLMNALNKLQYLGGMSNLPKAMRLWYELHRPRSKVLGRQSHVIIMSDVQVSPVYNDDFTKEAALWRTLTVTGEVRTIVISTTNANTTNMEKFTPLHTFSVQDYLDIADIVSQVISVLPCKDKTPLPFEPYGTVLRENSQK